MNTTVAEENYLKAVYKHSPEGQAVSTNRLAAELGTTPASVTDMVKKLSDKGYVDYVPYRGVSLTPVGLQHALYVVRKHRLWETFLVEKLHFGWHEVHETAEQLEHIHSQLLIDKLDAFLGFPKFDPHGEPIPDQQGRMTKLQTVLLYHLAPGVQAVITGVLTDNSEFLQHISRFGIQLHVPVLLVGHTPFDGSVILKIAGEEKVVSSYVAQHIHVLPKA